MHQDDMDSNLTPNWLHGKLLVAAITSVCSSAFLLFGYDQGVMSGIVVSNYWLDQMGHPSTVMLSTITALYDVGAFFGAIFSAISSEPLGRRRTLIIGSVFVIVGSVIMGASYERIQMIVGRIVTGIGVGFLTSAAPVYQSEICLPAYRGWHLSCQLSQMLLGLVISYWVNYGFYYCHGHVQWRFPLCLQIVFAIYCIVVTLFLPDSPRWLMWNCSSPEQGVRVLAALRDRPIDDPMVCEEKDEILSAIQRESEEQGSWKDLLRDGGNAANKRFLLALGIQFTQQLTGINIISYYAPTIFKSSLGMSQERSLFVSSFLQVWYILASFLTWYMIDRIGRRRLFISMALGMCVILVCEAICVRVDNQSSNIAAVFFIFAFEACFTWGWMACVWVYPAEILPLRIRSKGAALAAAADFLGNFLVVEIAPPALANIGYKTYIIFAVFNVVTALMVWCFYPETTGLSLETIDTIFFPDDEDGTQQVEGDCRLYRKFQWNVVPKAWSAVKAKKAEDRARNLSASIDRDFAKERTLSFEKEGDEDIKQIEVEHIP